MHLKTLMIRKWQFISVKDILRLLLSKIRSCYYLTLSIIKLPKISFIMFYLAQLSLNPENFPLELIGNIDSESDFFKIAYKYIRNVALMDVDDLRWNNYFSEAENRNHFILFNSWESFQENTREDVYLPQKAYQFAPTDMSKEALFNVINNHFSFEGLKILDLFSGTGNISYEFASRGSTNYISRWRLWLWNSSNKWLQNMILILRPLKVMF
jgi:hypothetical protein